VEDRDPIKQIQHLLDDPGKVLEKISRIQSALGSIDEPRADTAPVNSSAEAAQSETETYQSLLRMLRDMQTQIEERLRPLALQTIDAESERLCGLAKQEQTALDECMARIDRSLQDCVAQIDESQRAYTDLIAANRRLLELGAPAETLPEFPGSQDPNAFLQKRIQQLHQNGKI
jgi:hypothetical protein